MEGPWGPPGEPGEPASYYPYYPCGVSQILTPIYTRHGGATQKDPLAQESTIFLSQRELRRQDLLLSIEIDIVF
ncbi:hypothetical protein QR680_018437 [Steinernema hermaphroditum]|uniref:Uncharacterized protein n=1 Tax=Steinernema hermaphroditum TaxID=289476 RepID=A0AA39HK76_9BILA|nr:hypothetical protein QR680_018437 [Steinernema hermaphroditum]